MRTRRRQPRPIVAVMYRHAGQTLQVFLPQGSEASQLAGVAENDDSMAMEIAAAELLRGIFSVQPSAKSILVKDGDRWFVLFPLTDREAEAVRGGTWTDVLTAPGEIGLQLRKVAEALP